MNTRRENKNKNLFSTNTFLLMKVLVGMIACVVLLAVVVPRPAGSLTCISEIEKSKHCSLNKEQECLRHIK
jgi:hypothetical protein